MEHLILYGICVIIAYVSTPRATIQTETMQAGGEFYFETGLSTSISCTIAIPLWVAFEVLLWFGKFSGLFN
jgi:hypothetical protein